MNTKVEVPKAFRVLLAESVAARAFHFSLTGGDHIIRHVSTIKELQATLQEGPWDLVITNIYLAGWQKDSDGAADIITAHKAGKIRGVIVQSPCHEDAKKYSRLLFAAGVPVGYLPLEFDSSLPINSDDRAGVTYSKELKSFHAQD